MYSSPAGERTLSNTRQLNVTWSTFGSIWNRREMTVINWGVNLGLTNGSNYRIIRHIFMNSKKRTFFGLALPLRLFLVLVIKGNLVTTITSLLSLVTEACL